jgi:hypothetical protein
MLGRLSKAFDVRAKVECSSLLIHRLLGSFLAIKVP